jgi:hypothetical protein
MITKNPVQGECDQWLHPLPPRCPTRIVIILCIMTIYEDDNLSFLLVSLNILCMGEVGIGRVRGGEIFFLFYQNDQLKN